jgi:hypothetical protein
MAGIHVAGALQDLGVVSELLGALPEEDDLLFQGKHEQPVLLEELP